MKIFTAILRLILLVIGFTVFIKSGFDIQNNDFYIGLGIIVISIYFMIMTKFGIDSISCPMTGCNTKK